MYFLDKINAMGGVAVAVLTYVLGEHWYLFAYFLFMNGVDYIIFNGGIGENDEIVR